ncbi:MAG TPA: hypothetical protein VI589_07530, partial [Vicinamibacteria bacterium]
MTTLPLQSDVENEPPRRGSKATVALLVVLILLLGAVGFLVYRAEQRMAGVERSVAAQRVHGNEHDAAAIGQRRPIQQHGVGHGQR